jgi:hypothetical protein
MKDAGIGVKLDNNIINYFKYIKERIVLEGPINKHDDNGKIMANAKGVCPSS